MFLSFSCNVVPIATVQLELNPEEDVSGSSSSIARIRFSDFTASLIDSGSTLRITFTNVEGDQLQIDIDDSIEFESGRYDINDTSALVLRATVTQNFNTRTLDLTASSGFINMNQIVTDSDGVLQQLAGSFRASFEVGEAQGQFNTGGG